jgi:hypothetical protein
MKHSSPCIGQWAAFALSVALPLFTGACDRQQPWLRRDEPPPFELFGPGDMRPGVSLRTLTAAAAKERARHRWRCRPVWARAQSCALTVQPGELRAIVDSTGRVIRLTVVAPDSFFVWEETPRNERTYRFYVGRLRTTWDSIRTHRVGPTDRGAEYRWVDPSGRWSGQMWYSPWSRYKTQDPELRDAYRDSLTRVPDSISVTDGPKYSKFIALRPPPPPGERAKAVAEMPKAVPVYPVVTPRPASPPRPTPRPPVAITQAGVPSELRAIGDDLSAALQQLARAQRRYYLRYWRYSPVLGPLGWRNDGDIELRLAGVTPDGWAAVAIHRAVPSRSCVYYQGSVRAPPKTLAERHLGAERSVICDSF